MPRIDFIRKPRAGGSNGLPAFLASCIFHGLLFGLVVGLGLFYQSHMPPLKNGSAPGSASILFEKMVITSPPPPPPAPPAPKDAPALVTPAPAIAAPESPRAPVAVSASPLAPALAPAVQPAKPMPSTKAVPIQPAIPRAVSLTAASPAPRFSKPATAAPVSSFEPGPNVLPHPPYPTEARDLRETGVVIMMVQFDVQGDVARAEVAHSSGVALLDSETRSFIRTHWHSPAHAGQAVSVPVQYKLERL